MNQQQPNQQQPNQQQPNQPPPNQQQQQPMQQQFSPQSGNRTRRPDDLDRSELPYPNIPNLVPMTDGASDAYQAGFTDRTSQLD